MGVYAKSQASLSQFLAFCCWRAWQEPATGMFDESLWWVRELIRDPASGQSSSFFNVPHSYLANRLTRVTEMFIVNSARET